MTQIYMSQMLLTYPQCPLSKEDFLERFTAYFGTKLKCCIVAQEDHHESDGKHIHVWLKATKAIRVSSKKSFGIYWDVGPWHGNWERVTINKFSVRKVIEYVTKDGNYVCWNCDLKSLLSDKHIKKYGTDILKMPVLEAAEKVSPLELPRLVKARKTWELLNFDPSTHYTLKCKGIWLWGDSGVGKTVWAHDFGDYVGGWYSKGPSKFWDGYEDQPCVIMDEARSSALFDAGYINLWADKCPYKAEFKGGMCWLQHRYFIITSNLSPREFCEHKGWFDQTLYEAVCRRFIIREVRKCDLPEDHPYLEFNPDDVFDNPWCTAKEAKLGKKEDVSSSRDAAKPSGSQAADVSQSAAPFDPTEPPASKIAPSMDFQNPFPF